MAPLSTLLLVLSACGGGAAASASAAESQAEADASVTAASEPASEASADAGAATEVRMTQAVFEPVELTVGVGTEVVFINDDSFAHTVTEGTDGTAVADPIVDDEVGASEEGRVVFDEAGTFDITCRFHPDMQMTISVEG